MPHRDEVSLENGPGTTGRRKLPLALWKHHGQSYSGSHKNSDHISNIDNVLDSKRGLGSSRGDDSDALSVEHRVESRMYVYTVRNNVRNW